jgi:predicted TIM-barrel fold metal-dependent hydrolase
VPVATTGDTLGFVDVHAWFGPDHGTAATAGASLGSLVEARTAHGIRISLASSLLASSADGATGNRIAAEAAADRANGLAAIAVIGPRRTGIAPRLVEEAAKSGAVGFRLDGWDGASPPSEAVREVLRAIADAGRPLLIPLERPGAASQIGAATAELGIPVVLLGAHYTHVVDDLAAAVRYPHLHLETSAMAHFRAIETAVRTIGPERLLLGTGSPVRAAASPIDAILASTIPDDAKRLVLGGNAIRLFGLPGGPIELPDMALPERAFDVHAHFGPLDFDVPQVADVDLLGALRVAPAQAAVASSGLAIFGDPVRGNDQAVRAVAASGAGGMGAYVVADPTDLQTTAEQLRRHVGAPGVLGVKVHGEWSRTPTASRAMADLFGLLAEFGRPVKIHNAGVGWDEALGSIARRHPRLPIIIAHGGLGTPSVEGARLAAANDNVYVELSSSFAHLPTVREAVAIAGPERLLWGSDGPLLEPAFVLGIYWDAGLPADDLDRVFWTNAAGLFGW